MKCLRMRAGLTALLSSVMLSILSPAASAQPQSARSLDAALVDVRAMVAAAPGDLGLVVAVTDRERLRLIVAHGFADIKARTPATTDTLFAIGSISKSFTAVALMQLADEGKFDPDAPISRYLPDFHPNSRFPEITGQNLLTHGAGLPNYRADLASMQALITDLNAFELRYAPGTHFWYSNSGYQLLGYAAERIDRRSFPTLLQQRVLDRIGMSATWPQIDDRLHGVMATSYIASAATGGWVEAPWFDYLAADGGIVSTGTDMAAYARMLLNDGATSSGRVLSKTGFARFATPVLGDYAFGINARADGRILAHNGSIAGFNARLEAHRDDGFGVAILSNGPLDVALSDRIVARLSHVATGTRAPAYHSGAAASDLSAFAGRFVGANGRALTFRAGPGHQLTVNEGGNAIALSQVGRDTFGVFVADQGPRAFVFDRAAETGEVVGVSSGADWYVRPGAAVPVAASAEWKTLVGRYKAHGEEGPELRVFVEDGTVRVAAISPDVSLVTLEQTGPGRFRIAVPDYAPETLQFDTIIDGSAQHLSYSGQPLYRIALP